MNELAIGGGSPAYGFVATASACLIAGAVPIFVDIDPARIDAAITLRTKAIVPVHIGGCPVDSDRILPIARSRGLAVIEDACQAHAASLGRARVGSIAERAASASSRRRISTRVRVGSSSRSAMGRPATCGPPGTAVGFGRGFGSNTRSLNSTSA